MPLFRVITANFGWWSLHVRPLSVAGVMALHTQLRAVMSEFGVTRVGKPEGLCEESCYGLAALWFGGILVRSSL